MKKIVLTLAAMMSLTLAEAKTVNAPAPAAAPQANYDMTVSYRRLAVALGLNLDQMQSLQIFHDKYVADMDRIAASDDADKEDLVKEATAKELNYMRYILDNDQYRKYDQLINVTLTNRGLVK
jgi:hypothetical protein